MVTHCNQGDDSKAACRRAGYAAKNSSQTACGAHTSPKSSCSNANRPSVQSATRGVLFVMTGLAGIVQVFSEFFGAFSER